MSQIDEIIRGLSKPQRWLLKYGFYMNPEGCWGVDRALIRKGLREPYASPRLTELGKQVQAKLQEKEND